VMIAVVATNSDRIKKNLHSRCCTGWRAKKYPRIPEKALVLNSWIYRPATATALCRRPAPLSGSQRTSLLIPLAMVRALPLEPCASSHSIQCFIKHLALACRSLWRWYYAISPDLRSPPSSRHLWEAPLAVQDHRSVCQRPVILFAPWGVGCMIAFMRHKSRGS
jgi:hypothetical protein